ncbi:uncharacterized protein [Primulina eburnea]|uniref:uncharacterized protein n=1 Tax=Primulina eburnea TaxID=1245227 RepID=UPI003C6C4CA4
MKTAQSRQNSFADKRRRGLDFAVGYHVFVKIAPVKGVIRFGKRVKLTPRFIGPFEILDSFVGNLQRFLAVFRSAQWVDHVNFEVLSRNVGVNLRRTSAAALQYVPASAAAP